MSDKHPMFERLTELFVGDGRAFAKHHDVPLSIVAAAMIGAGTRLFDRGPEELALWFDAKARELRESLGRSADLN